MAEPRPDLTELFARAREVDVEAVAGVRLFRAGRRMRGECPLCGVSKGKKAGGAFSAEPTIGRWNCFGCGEAGDVVDLERLLRGGSLKDAAERLVGKVFAPRAAPPSGAQALARAAIQHAAGVDRATRLAQEIWLNCPHGNPFGGIAQRTYLEGRGLSDPAIVGEASRRLAFNPSALWGWDDAGETWLRAPALVGRVVTPDRATGGVHCTYLSATFQAKARLDPAKRMWGPMKDAEGRPGGVWLTPRTGDGPLIVGEGIESTLSAMQLYGKPCRGVATLSLQALQGGWLADRFGRRDPAAPAADPESPAFTWPEQHEVIVAVDRDMSPIEIKVRKPGGGTAKRRLTADERARICGGLATAAWRAAGANVVHVIAPAAGRDFNDELLARADRDRLGDPAEGDGKNGVSA